MRSAGGGSPAIDDKLIHSIFDERKFLKKKSGTKLTLDKETLRELKLKEPSLVQGGNEIDLAWPSCPSACATF
jgi:hypothetical protein